MKLTIRYGVALLLLPLAAAFVQCSRPAEPVPSSQSASGAHPVLFASVGPEVSLYDLDTAAATLVRRSAVMLPQNVQYAWPHASGKGIYVGWSEGVGGKSHGVSLVRFDPESGNLRADGEPIALHARPIHLTTDIPGHHLLVAYNNPPRISVHRLDSSGAIGQDVKPPKPLDVGIYPHQIRVDPSNRMVILVARGNDPTDTKPEELGAVKVFGYDNGILTNRQSIEEPRNFQPRHVDFHPSEPWVFLALERQNRLQVYRNVNSESLSSSPLFGRSTLAKPENTAPQQRSAAIHVHPNGRFVYVSNRSTTSSGPGEGENNIAVFSVNGATGQPELIQNIDTRGMTPRTFAIDPSGKILVVANQSGYVTSGDAGAQTVAAGMSVFRIGDDGKLEFARKYDVPTDGNKTLMWVGILSGQ